MNPWIAKVVMLAAAIAMIVIRAPHGTRSRSITVARSYRNRRELALMTLATIGMVVPLVWVFTPVFWFAGYPLRLAPLLVGVACLIVGLWLFHRSHVDLGTNWSVTLEVREHHRLITQGVYRHIRHPMYSALLLFAIGQALVVPNWIVGSSYLVAMAILYAFRVGPEERMMLETFGDEYAAYQTRTKRLVPRLW